MRCGRRIVAARTSWTTSLNVIEQVTAATPDDSHYSTLVYGWAKQAELHEEHTGDVAQDVFRIGRDLIRRRRAVRHASESHRRSTSPERSSPG